MHPTTGNDFEQAAARATAGFWSEYWAFLCYNKKWWLLPILAVLLLFSILILLSGTAAQPFIYTLF